MQTSDNSHLGWAERPRVQQRIRYALYAVCGLLVFADLIVHRHTYLPIEELPAFYAFYGFGALIVLVQLSKALRRVVGRSEDYYQRDSKDGDHNVNAD